MVDVKTSFDPKFVLLSRVKNFQRTRSMKESTVDSSISNVFLAYRGGGGRKLRKGQFSGTDL